MCVDPPLIIIIIVDIAIVVVVVNNNNFPICYPGCLSTRRRHSQIRNEDYGSFIFTCPAHTIDVRQNRFLVPASASRLM